MAVLAVAAIFSLSGEPGGARRSQEGPGGARRSQEEPGGARKSQDAQARVSMFRGSLLGRPISRESRVPARDTKVVKYLTTLGSSTRGSLPQISLDFRGFPWISADFSDVSSVLAFSQV